MMSTDPNSGGTGTAEAVAARAAALRSLDRLVGTWTVSGPTS